MNEAVQNRRLEPLFRGQAGEQRCAAAVVELVPFAEISEAERLATRAWRNSPEVAKYFRIRHIDEATHRAWLEKMSVAEPSVVAFVIRVDGRDVGVTYFHSIDRERHACDWGIYIHDISCRGRGVGNEVLRRMLDFASAQLNMESVFLDVHADNERAIALYERHGFVRCPSQESGDFIRYERRMR